MLLITSVYDSVAKRYLGFQLVEREEVAVRGFIQALQEAFERKEGPYYYNPADYSLTYLGSFDQEDGTFADFDNAHVLYRGSTFIGVNHEKE